jgi:hypothetical protein
LIHGRNQSASGPADNQAKTKFMKAAITRRAEKPPTPVFQIAIRKRGAAAAASPKPPKRDNIFSQSSDTREDRGERQMKTTHNSQTLPHGR